MDFHEDFAGGYEPKPPSARLFAFSMGVLFSVLALFPLIRHQRPRWWALAAAATLVVLGVVRPAVLSPLARLFFRLSGLLVRVAANLTAALLFYLVFTPVGLLAKLSGRDPLRLRNGRAGTYWVRRNPPGPEPETMSRQF